MTVLAKNPLSAQIPGNVSSPMPDAAKRLAATAVGQGDCRVGSGDCLLNIAARVGIPWRTIWDHPDNAELKKARGDPRVLLEGDKVVIPTLRPREYLCQTESLHRFCLHLTKTKLRLKFLRDGEPRANQRCVLEFDGQVRESTTDGNGVVEIPVPPTLQNAIAHVGSTSDESIYELQIGQLDPNDSVRGVQERLMNLGLFAGPADGIWRPAVETAMRTFQSLRGLDVTGEADETTLSELKKQHGS